jgi:hypothetical protein
LTFLSIIYFLVQLSLLHILRYAKVIDMLSSTLSFAFHTLMSFSVIFVVYFIGSAQTAYMMFTTNEEYSSFYRSVSTLASASLGKFNFVSLIDEYGNVGAFFLLVYLCMMFFIILNMFVTMINDSLTSVKKGEVQLSEDCKVIDHTIEVFKSFLPGQHTKRE